jgi:hypothetical protein
VRSVRRLSVVAVLVIVGTATAVAPFVLPKPSFPGPARGPGSNTVHFEIVSSTAADPARLVTAPRGVYVEGTDGNTRHIVAASSYLDFKHYAWAPRVVAAERPFTYEQVVYARESGTLFVETAHQTYAKSTYGLNGYLNAIDPRQRKLLWRSLAQVANALNFVLLNETVITGYGFTAEPDYLYAIDRTTGHVKGRVLLPSAPERIARHGNVLTVDTYDHRLTVRVTGA